MHIETLSLLPDILRVEYMFMKRISKWFSHKSEPLSDLFSKGFSNIFVVNIIIGYDFQLCQGNKCHNINYMISPKEKVFECR